MGYLFTLFAQRESGLIIEIDSQGQRVAAIERGFPGDLDPPCRQFERRQVTGPIERFSDNTGCLGGEGPILGKQADGTLLAQYVNCGQVPTKIGRVTVACEGNVAQPPPK
jgi:hypothetical protein